MGEQNESCPCKRKNCEWYGRCEECRAHHEVDRRYPPYCDKVKEKVKKKADGKKHRRSLNESKEIH